MKKTLLASTLVLAMSSSAFVTEDFYVYGGAGYSKVDINFSNTSYVDEGVDSKFDRYRLSLHQKHFHLTENFHIRKSKWLNLVFSHYSKII